MRRAHHVSRGVAGTSPAILCPPTILALCYAPAKPQEPCMITAIVRFKLRETAPFPAATELFKGSAPKYQNLPGLVRKYYLYGEGTGGGVYLWKSRADAERVYTAEWRAMIAQRYG